MNKLQISQKLKNFIGRFKYIQMPPGILQDELLKLKCDLEILERQVFKEYLEETNK